MIIKKITGLLVAALMVFTPVRAESFVVLEALVQMHKTLSNRLKERNGIESSVVVAVNNTTNKTGNYEDIITKLQKRIEGSYASVQFVSELAALTSQASRTASLSVDAVEYALDNAVNNPLILDATVYVTDRTAQCINSIYRLMAMVAGSGTGVVLATNEDRTQFCFMVRSKLMEIQKLMENLIQLSIGESLIAEGNPADRARMRAILNGSQHQNAADRAGRLIDRAANTIR